MDALGLKGEYLVLLCLCLKQNASLTRGDLWWVNLDFKKLHVRNTLESIHFLSPYSISQAGRCIFTINRRQLLPARNWRKHE